MRKRPGKRLLLLVAIIALLYLSWRFLGAGSVGDQAQMQAPGVEVAQVIVRPVTEWSEFSGRFEAVDIVQLRPRVTGTIDRVHFNDGDFVQAGQTLFTIDPRPFRAALALAQGRMAAAQAAVQNARGEADRAGRLAGANAISQRENEQRQAAMRVAQGELDAARAAVEQAALNVEYSSVQAPISGKVGRAEITEGNLVEAGGPVLTTMVAIDPIYAGFEIDEGTYLSLLRGMDDAALDRIPVQAGTSGQEGTPYTGTLASVDNRLNAGSGTLRARALIQNDNRVLLPGLFAKVRIGTPEPVMSVLVNESAIGTDQTKKFVYVVTPENMVEYAEVQLGPVIDQPEGRLRVIRSGLTADHRVIVKGLLRVRPGVPVQPTPVDMFTLAPLNPPAGAAPQTVGEAVGEAVGDAAEDAAE